MSHVSHETAKRLQDAGFPQPTPQVGQYWYTKSGILLWLQYMDELSAFFSDVGNSHSREWYLEMFDNLIFAPTAEDILRELSDWDFVSYFSPQAKKFWCEHTKRSHLDSVDENFSEACAAAYLKLNSK